MLPLTSLRTNPNLPADETPSPLLSRSKLYDRLAQEYYLPCRGSRAITRDYLLGVESDRYFRVENRDMKLFLAEVSPKTLKRSLCTHNREVAEKVDALLREHGLPCLGFGQGLLPDSKWLTEVARYVDPRNAAGLFEEECGGTKKRKDIDSTRVLEVKRRVEKILLVDTGLLAKRHMNEGLSELWTWQKRLKAKEGELREVTARGRVLAKEIEEGRTQVRVMLNSLSELVVEELEKAEGDNGVEKKEKRRVKAREA